MTLFIWTTAFIALLISYRKDKFRTIGALKKGLNSIKNISAGLLAMISVAGFTLAIFPDSVLVNIFNTSGVQGFILVSTIGAIINVPGPIAFPLAGTFLKMGIQPALLASFITTLTMVGLATAPVESSTFGKRFTFVRQSLSFFSAVAIGLMMGGLTVIWSFTKRFKVFFIIQAMAVALYFFRPELSQKIILNSLYFSVEVLVIMPPIMLILGLLDAWIPSRTIENHLGKESGISGWLAAVALGSAAAGPLLAALPIAASLSQKGARTANVVIFLGSWATIKLPLLIMEIQFLGFRFSILRFALTLPLIIITGLLTERLAPLSKSSNYHPNFN